VQDMLCHRDAQVGPGCEEELRGGRRVVVRK
jgi:hypothetical protein